MLKLLKQEKVFKVKVDCIQKNIGASKSPLFLSSSGQEKQKGIDFDNIIFTFQINKKFYFTKTLIEVDQFCKEYTQLIKCPLVMAIGELFSYCINESYNSVQNMSQDQERGINQDGSLLDISRRYQALHHELESISKQLQGYL
jgi:hypothetical protein